ncbi:MAG: hypothetical protein JW774_09725 [Candidatus Aureabacteria bacterium]|nr:hypothetical protein [Candidatus Auribacterota bacterium]
MRALHKKKLAMYNKIATTITLFMGYSFFASGDSGEGYVLGCWRFTGNRYFSEKNLNQVLGLIKGEAISQNQVEESLQKIKEKYKSEGFFFVEVDVSRNRTSAEEIELNYHIDEGNRVKVREVQFIGNTKVKENRLKKLVQTKPGVLFRRNYLQEKVLQEDSLAIENHYQFEGLGDCRVKQIKKKFSEDGDSVDLTFIIEESPEVQPLFYGDATTGGELEKEDRERFQETTSIETPPVIGSQILPGSESSQEESSPIQKWPHESSLMPPAVLDGKTDLQEQQEEESALPPEREGSMISADQPIGSDPVSSTDNPVSSMKQEKTSLPTDAETLRSLLREKEEVESLLSGLLAKAKIENRDLKRQIGSLKEEVRSLQNRLDINRAELEKLQQNVSRNRKMERQIAAERDSAVKRVQVLSDLVGSKLSELEKVRDHLNKVLSETRSEIARELDRIELAPIAVPQEKSERDTIKGEQIPRKKETAYIEKEKLTGQVLVVNPTLNFIVLNIGANKGVYKDMRMEISRGEKRVAITRVIEVRRNICASDIEEGNANDVKVGDEVREYGE